METISSVENEFVTFTIKEGVLIGVFKKDIKIDLDAAKKILKLRLDFIQGKSHPMLIIDGGVKELNRDARVFFFTEEGRQNVLAAAFIVKNTFTKIIVSFFTKLTHSPFPNRSFTNEDEAFAWLKTFVEK
jgi:hypothetical protein